MTLDLSDIAAVCLELGYMVEEIDRGLEVSGGDDGQLQFGKIYLVGGLLYGAQCLGHWAQEAGWLVMTPLQEALFATGFTAVFVAYLTWLKRRGGFPNPTGMVARAAGAAFAAAGTTNCIMVVVFYLVAHAQQNLLVWLLYPCMVVALQGGAWLTAYALRRQVWQAILGLGWMATAIAMAATVGSPTYLLILAISLLVLMAGGGLYMVTQVRKAV